MEYTFDCMSDESDWHGAVTAYCHYRRDRRSAAFTRRELALGQR